MAVKEPKGGVGVEMEGCPGSQLEHLEGLAGMVVCMDSSNLQDTRVPQEVWSLPLNHTYLKLENTQWVWGNCMPKLATWVVIGRMCENGTCILCEDAVD